MRRSWSSGIIAAGVLGAAVVSAQEPAAPVVTGAPYSAEAITTVKARLFDGTRIDRSITARFYRDSAGRVRREQTVVGLEALDPSNDFRAVVTIVDPVAGVVYTLNPGSREAYRIPIAGAGSPAAAPAGKQESLGTRDIEGERAIGSRTTVTIPAGQVGNDRPIVITDERWESADLKVLLFSRHSDPRTGEIEYRLTKLRRGEPARDLFVVPAGYTLRDLPQPLPAGTPRT